jgi:polysaccharide biosynthesis transport protein
MTTPTDTFRELPVSEDHSEAQRNGALFEQWSMPRPTVAQAVLRCWFLVLIPALLLAGAGAALALRHPPTYTSEATLNVGRPDPSSPAFGGYVTAAAGLATVYSREIGAPGVIGPVSKKLQLSQGVIGGRLSATPIEDSPIIRVIATGPSASAAEALANAGASALTTYITAANRQDPDAGRLFGQYQGIAGQKAQNDQQLAKDNQALNLDPGNSALRARIALESANSNVLGLRLTALNGAYVAAEASQAATNIITPLSPATSASSDRSSKVQKLAGAGLLAGLVIGVALAMWRANWVTRRRLLG